MKNEAAQLETFMLKLLEKVNAHAKAGGEEFLLGPEKNYFIVALYPGQYLSCDNAVSVKKTEAAQFEYYIQAEKTLRRWRDTTGHKLPWATIIRV